MVSFRKLFPVLVVIGLLMAAGTASAQVSNCTASSLTPLVRVEGLTEPAGKITVSCDVAANTAAQTLYFKVMSSSVNFTNTLQSDKTTTNATATSGTSVVNGKLISATEIDFNGVAIPTAAAATTVTIVIDNLRVNASTAAKNTNISATITGTAVAVGSTQTLQILNATKDIANVQQGLTFSVSTTDTVSQCSAPTGAPTTSTAVLKFTPGYAFAFRAGEGVSLEARFTGVPAGADLYVTKASTSTGSTATMDTTATTTYVKVTVGSDGTASAKWLIDGIATDPTTPITFGVALVQHATGTQIGLGTVQVAGNFAPRSTVTTASSAATTDVPLPRFVDATPNYSNVITVNPCATTLLFPYVTNQGGFDTGLAISNTSKDFKAGDNFLFSGTDKELTGQPGTCTLNYFGGQGATASTTPTINPGQNQAFMLSSVASGFQGYIVAQCNFVNAHGFAFLTSGPNGMTMGYNALVIPRGSRTATGGQGFNGAETLGQ